MDSDQTVAYMAGYRDGDGGDLPNSSHHFYRDDYIRGYVDGSINRSKRLEQLTTRREKAGV